MRHAHTTREDARMADVEAMGRHIERTYYKDKGQKIDLPDGRKFTVITHPTALRRRGPDRVPCATKEPMPACTIGDVLSPDVWRSLRNYAEARTS